MALPNNILGLDVGDRRIGVALMSDEGRMPAVLETIDRQKIDPLERLNVLIQKHYVGSIVIGLPRDMAGRETNQTAIVRVFSGTVHQHTGLPVVLQDEAVTSIKAEEELRARNKPYSKADIDALSAVYILEDWATSPDTTEIRL